MDIEGLGEKNVELLVSRGLISHFEDIYRIRKEDLRELPRFAEKSAQNLTDAIEKSKAFNTGQISSLPSASSMSANMQQKFLARNFRGLDDLYHVKKVSILGIKQVGEKIATSVLPFSMTRRTSTCSIP